MTNIFDERERNFILIGFFLSLFHWGICAVFFAVLTLRLISQGIPGCLKVLLIITIRHLLSRAVASQLNGVVQAEKWAIIFLLSFYIIAQAGRYSKPRGMSVFGGLLALFSIYVIAVSPATSSYPLVSIFKVLSYAIPFYAVVLGVAVTNEECNWIHYMKQVLILVVYACILTIPIQGRFNYINGTFQGVLNHPNMMGIFLSLFIACYLFDKETFQEKPDKLFYIILLLSFYMLYKTASRTGMFSALICLIIYWYGLPAGQKGKTAGVFIAGAVILGLLMIVNPSSGILDSVNSFVFKRQETGINELFDSRILLMEASKQKHALHPLTGSGFGVPWNYGYVDWSFSTSMTYESGNLYYTILGDTGNIGAVLFVLYMIPILLRAGRKKLVLFALPIIISMGEMAFFSTNNIAILYFIFYGICMSDERELANAT